MTPEGKEEKVKREDKESLKVKRKGQTRAIGIQKEDNRYSEKRKQQNLNEVLVVTYGRSTYLQHRAAIGFRGEGKRLFRVLK